MGRPSLATERTEQIVLAACRCAARSGLDGATLEQISLESGLSRGHIRHYVGSRDDLMDLVWARVSESFLSRLTSAPAGDPRGRVEQLLDRLFADDTGDDSMPHIGAFLLSGLHHPTLRSKLDRTMTRIEGVLETALQARAPRSSASERADVVAGLLQLLLGSSAYLTISARQHRSTVVREVAERLVHSLEVARPVRDSTARAAKVG